MAESSRYSAHKFFRSFRLNVQPQDQIGFELLEVESDDTVLNESVYGKQQLLNLSLSGLAFVGEYPFEPEASVKARIRIKKKTFDFTGEVVRVARYQEKAGSYVYGVKLYKVSDENARQFIESLVAHFSSRRLKRELVNLMANEVELETPGVNDVMALMEGLYSDLKRFEHNQRFFEVLLGQARRVLDCEKVSVYQIDSRKTDALKILFPKQLRERLCLLDITGSLYDQIRYRKEVTHLRIKESDFSDTLLKQREELESIKIREILLVPLFNREGDFIGLLEAINKKGENRFFQQRDYLLGHFFGFMTTSLVLDCLYDTNLDTISIERPVNARKLAFIGEGKESALVRQYIQQNKANAEHLIIGGESGTGKELLAKIIHTEGTSGMMPLGIMDCRDLIADKVDLSSYLLGGGETIGKFDLYSGGCLIIKQLELLSSSELATLAHLLTKTAGMRIIATTKLTKEQLQDHLPSVLLNFFQSSETELRFFALSPLRERTDDIPPLIRYFLKKVCSEQGIPAKKMAAPLIERFMDYDWPDNIRELKRSIERLVLYSSGTNFIQELPPHGATLFDPLARQRRSYLEVMKAFRELSDEEQNLLLAQLQEQFEKEDASKLRIAV